MNLGDFVAQNLTGVLQGVLTTVLGYLALRILRGIRASTDRTEEHAAATAEKLSQLDTVSVSSSNAALEQWQRDMALRIEAVADGRSDALAWQANVDRKTIALDQAVTTQARRLAALEEFAIAFDQYARSGGQAPVPTYTGPIRVTTQATELQEEPA